MGKAWIRPGNSGNGRAPGQKHCRILLARERREAAAAKLKRRHFPWWWLEENEGTTPAPWTCEWSRVQMTRGRGATRMHWNLTSICLGEVVPNCSQARSNGSYSIPTTVKVPSGFPGSWEGKGGTGREKVGRDPELSACPPCILFLQWNKKGARSPSPNPWCPAPSLEEKNMK